jgi:hypothetical protein
LVSTSNTPSNNYSQLNLFKLRAIAVIAVGAMMIAVAGYSSQGGHKDKVINQVNSEKINYTCPMYPELISDKPGSCPKRGMDQVKSDARG